jgi:hypothetical protein
VDDFGGEDARDAIQDYDLGTVAASRLVAGFRTMLHGWAICEATGAAVAKVRIHDGGNAGGAVVAPIALAASGTSFVFMPGEGIDMGAGVFLELVSGSVEATLYIRRVPR